MLKYSAMHVEDYYGGLGDQPIEREEFAPFEIAETEFESAWTEAHPIGKDAPKDFNDVFRAIAFGDANALRALVANGCDVNAPDPRPYIGHLSSPLHAAASAGSAELVRILLEAGALVDARCADGWTPLMRACNAGAFDVAKALVDAGADIEAKNSEGYTAYGRVPTSSPELLAFMKLHHELTGFGIMRRAATALQSAAARRSGMLVICGPAGVGKTTLAEVLTKHTGMVLLGDLRMPDEIRRRASASQTRIRHRRDPQR